jgi:carbon-monoxide dehydrogenase medium subunit
VYPAAFDYHRPETIDETVGLLARLGGEAKLLAGGASLIPLMKLRLAQPAHIVDLAGVPGLDGVTEDDGTLVIGAMVREVDLTGSTAARRLPILADAVRVIADPLVRNVGTIGGNVAHGDPANDHPAILLALDAAIVIRGPTGERTIPVREFHLDALQTVLGPDEVLTAIRIPLPGPATGMAYVKFERQVGDYAIAAAAAVVEMADGRVARARIAFTNLAPTPVRAPSIEAALTGLEAGDTAIAAAVEALRDDEIAPWDDLRGTAAQKRRMARAVAERALRLARDRATRDRATRDRATRDPANGVQPSSGGRR